MSSVVAFTIAARNYTAQVRTLMQSIRETSPGITRVVVVVDPIPEWSGIPEHECAVVSLADLNLPAAEWLMFKYSLLELSTAIKPWAIEYLMAVAGASEVIYLDPDILVMDSLTRVTDALVGKTALLTPHLTRPLDDGCRPSELDILRAGTYNLGFLALRDSVECRQLLSWWQERLFDRCVVSPDHGLFVDQKWMDLCPSFFDGVQVIRDPGWNVAYWNLSERVAEQRAARFFVNGHPLLFFHFSGFDASHPGVVSKHQNRFRMDDVGIFAELFKQYASKLRSNGVEHHSLVEYALGTFSNGMRLPDIVRPVHHEDPSIVARVEDPFSDAGREQVAAVWNRAAMRPDGKPSDLTLIAHRVYMVREDVRSAMPDLWGRDHMRYLRWFEESGRQEHQLDGMWRATVDCSRYDIPVEGLIESTPSVGLSEWLRGTGGTVFGLRRAVWERWGDDNLSDPEIEVEIVDWLLEKIGSDSPWRAGLRRLEKLILDSRPDVFARCSQGEEFNEGWFYAWLVTYGVKEYGPPEIVRSSWRESWQEQLSLSGLTGGLTLRLTAIMLRLSAYWSGRDDRGKVLVPSVAAQGRTAEDCRRVVPQVRLDRSALPFGVNLIGYAEAATGVGQSARLARVSLEKAGVQVNLECIPQHGRAPWQLVAVPPRFRFDVAHVNADCFAETLSKVRGSFGSTANTIGYWAWELEEFPDRFYEAFEACAEIWTPSSFCQRAIQALAPVPVVVIPHPVTFLDVPMANRSEWGVGPEEFVFLCMADMLSVRKRKNPDGVIRAFLSRHKEMPNAKLIVKVNNAHCDPSGLRLLMEAEKFGVVRVVAKEVTRDAADRLLASADCFVSLHRSEGFGLPMAEAMSLGKPVIASRYSGNMDFMDDSTAFLVDCERGHVPEGCGPYRAGAAWAEPSIEHASAQMVAVYSDHERRNRIALAGQSRVRQHCCPETVGRLMRNRLEKLTMNTGKAIG